MCRRQPLHCIAWRGGPEASLPQCLGVRCSSLPQCCMSSSVDTTQRIHSRIAVDAVNYAVIASVVRRLAVSFRYTASHSCVETMLSFGNARFETGDLCSAQGLGPLPIDRVSRFDTTRLDVLAADTATVAAITGWCSWGEAPASERAVTKVRRPRSMAVAPSLVQRK